MLREVCSHVIDFLFKEKRLEAVCRCHSYLVLIKYHLCWRLLFSFEF